MSIEFVTSVANPNGNQNSTRETEAQRIVRMTALLDGATFLGVIGYDNAEKFVAGQSLTLPDKRTATVASPAAIRCACCGGINGEPKRGSKDWNPARLAMMCALTAKDGRTVTLSDTCRAKYLEPLLAKLKAGASIYRTIYPKAPASGK